MLRHVFARLARRGSARSGACPPGAARARSSGAGALALVVGGTAALTLATASPAVAQYFGRNKVNYETFDFRILQTPKFDIHYYPAESTATADAARMAERWYTRLSPFMRHELGRKSIIFFADQPDFQQNNVTTIESEGTGGVTEGFRQRVVMPFTGIYGSTHHVLGHELVHVFQYDIAEKAGGAQGLNQLPLWLVEGMAEYLSLGREDVNTATWLRDAARRDDVPTIRQLTTDPRYFPYRYGQALWAYVGGRFGDQAVVDVFRQSLRYGFEGAIRRVLDVTTDQLSKDWAASIKSAYLPLLAGRTAPDSTGTAVVRQKGARGGEYNTSPVLSPDGRSLAFFSSRGLFGIDLYVADAETGRVRRQLSSINSPRHFDALSFINSAGSWSPDGQRLVYLVYREGNQELEIFDLARGRATKRLRTPGIGAAVDPAWSPDGRYIAFAGHVGGISDLFLYDLETDRVERLTDDREAQLQPAWSPDGRSLAFATDAGPGTNFERLTFAPMRLATMDVSARTVRLLAAFPGARHINPQWSADGRSLYFIADPDGFSDVYRLELASGARFRLTRTATGISGITGLTPALSVARNTGRVAFSVFDRGGYHINRLEAGEAAGIPVEGAGPTRTIATAGATGGDGGVLPPATPARRSPIEAYLADATSGLPRDTTYDVEPYSPRLRLDYVAPPSVGVGYSNQLGAVAGGGVAAAFSDQLGNRNVTAVAQVQGQLQDFGGQLFYTNTRRRWNWGGGVGRIPFLTGGAFYEQDAGGNLFLTQILQRIYVDQASGLAQYPLNPTQRFEFAAGVTRQSYGVQAFRSDQFGRTERIDRSELPFGLPPAVTYAQGTAAFVGDYSVFGLTSPIAGGRYRFEASPTAGQLQFTTATADYRRYWLARPVTFAVRGLHFGRYGRDAEDSTRIAPVYAGFAQFIRGYDVGNNLANQECSTERGSRCPVFDRLIGSRIGLASAELRIPLLGVEGLGLIRTNFLPLEIAPFFDAAVTWRSNESPDLRWASGDDARTAGRIPVFSTGVTARVNLLGFAVVEAFYAIPFQRPDKRGHFGFQLAPGW